MSVYNANVKGLYLEQFENLETKEVYARLFRKLFETENEYSKDFCNFNDEEIELFLKNVLKPKTKESARTYCNVLANYIQWTIENGFSEQTTNPIKRRQEFFYEFVPVSKMYFSYQEKQAIIKNLMNKQDSFIIEALWNGIEGTKVSELVNLRIKDIDNINNIIKIRDNNGNITREIAVDEEDEKVIEMAILANREREYYRVNGTVDYSPLLKESLLLTINSEYVLKTAHTSRDGEKKEGERVSQYTVYNRLEMIRTLEKMEEYQDALTTKNIVRSGMIYMALKLFQRDKELGRGQIEEICAKYNVKYKWSLRDFLNLEVLTELYPKEMRLATKENAMEK